MYAIVESGGMQIKVEKDSRVRIPKLDAEPGSEVRLDKVLALSEGNNFHVGSPYVKEALVKAKLLVHAKHEKIVVFKFKKRKNYRRKRGHRQDYSEILITEILLRGILKKEAAPKVKEKDAVPKAEKKKAPVKRAKRKAAAPVAVKKAKPTRARAKPVKKKITKKTEPRRKKAAKPASEPKKKTTRRVIGRLRKKKKKE